MIITIDHFLLHCSKYTIHWNLFKIELVLKNSFRQEKIKNLIKFIKATKLLFKIA